MALNIGVDHPLITMPGRFWQRGERRQWLAAMMCGCACVYAARTAMPLTVVALGKELHWSKTDSGTVLSAFFWGYTLTQVFGGYLSDRIGGAKVMTTAAIGWTLLTFWTPTIVHLTSNKSISFAIIVFSRVLVGGFQGVHYPSMTSVLSQRVSEEDRAFSFAMSSSGSNLGAIFTGSIGSLLLDRFGSGSPFHFIGIVCMLWLLVLRYYLMAKDERKARILSVKDDLSHQPDSTEKQKVPWGLLFKKMAFWALLVAWTSEGFTMHTILSWYPVYFYDNYPGYPGSVERILLPVICIVSSAQLAVNFLCRNLPWQTEFFFLRSILIGHLCQNNAFFMLLSWLPSYFDDRFPGQKGWVFNVVPWLMSIPCGIGSGLLADHMISKGFSTTYVRKLMQTIALLGTSFFLFLISFTSSFEGSLFCMAMAVGCCGFHSSGILVNPQDIAPKHAGSVFGLMNTAGAIPGFVGVYIAGYILETTHSWNIVFNQTAFVCIIGWIIFMIFGTGKKIV